MSTAALSIRSSGSDVDGRSSRRHINDVYNWDREALSENGALEPEPSGGSLSRTMPREGSRTSARPASASALSNNNSVSGNSGAAQSRRSTEARPQIVGMVQPWDEPEPDSPRGPRSRAASVAHASEGRGGGGGGGGGESSQVLSGESRKLSTRPPGSVAPSHRSHRGSGGGGKAPAPDGYEDAPGAGAPDLEGQEQQFVEEDESWAEEGRQGYGQQPAAGERAEQEQEEREAEGAASSAGAYTKQSDRGSRPGSGRSVTGPLEPEASGAGSPQPPPAAASRDGSRAPSTRPPSAPGHHHSAQMPPPMPPMPMSQGGGGRGSRRPSGGPVEMQDLPPEALPWSEPDYPSRQPSTVSINHPSPPAAAAAAGAGFAPAPPPLSQEPSRGSSRAPSSTAPSNRSGNAVRRPPGSSHQRPVEVPMLPLRDLLAGNRPPSVAACSEQPAPPAHPQTPQIPQSPQPAVPPAIAAAFAAEEPPRPLSREGSRTSMARPGSASAASAAASNRSAAVSHKASSQRSALDIPSYPPPQPDADCYYGISPAGTPSGSGGGGGAMPDPLPGFDSPRLTGPSSLRDGASSKSSMRPSSAAAASSSVGTGLDRKTPFATKSAVEWHTPIVEQLPWSARALADFKAHMKKATFVLSDPQAGEDPLAARMDAVFAMPQELWPVLPPGALYCLEAYDPRVGFGYLQHRDFPDIKVRVSTYFGKWCRHLVDYVVSWQPVPRAEAAWQPGDGKQPPLPWEPRQVVAHTTHGEYQYANTRIKFKGPRSVKPGAEEVEWSDAHGIDLLDTKAAHETASRNSDKDREAHLIDPPRPNTWGEMARRPLIGNLRSRGGGAYVHYVNYDHSGLRTHCGRRVPAGYFFSLIPNAAAKTPPVPGNSLRSSSVGRTPGGGLRAIGATEASSVRLRSVNAPAQALLGTFGDSVASSKWGAYMGAVASSGAIGIGNARPSSAGPRRSSAAAAAGSPPEGGGRLPHLASSISAAIPLDPLAYDKSAWSSGGGGGGGLQRESSRLAGPTSPTLVALAPRNRWRTYDVPFSHPIHSARAQELGADMAMAMGRGGVRTFSDAAAVLAVAEQELRLARPFVPGPLVVPSWSDIPRLYVEHMEAARQLMPVTELDNYGSSKLHMLIYHLECAATLEYDRLDAKLLLLTQMARLGRKSAEIDAWLQVIVEQAAYLYDKLEITDRSRWRQPPPQQPLERPPMRRSVTFAKAAALTNPNTGAPGAFHFPDPLVGTSFAGRSALNVAAQAPPPPPAQPLPVHCISTEEWSAITKIMDTCRHTILYEHWMRLRPLMTGSAQSGAGGSSFPSSHAGSMIAASSDACATASGFGGEGDEAATEVGDPFTHGSVNRELLDYVLQDIAAMSAPDFVPPPPPPAKLPKHRGYRGEGPLPPELVADMPVVHKPVRCRGADETPLPPEFTKMDIWNVTNKAEQVNADRGIGGPSHLDAGALRFSQVSVSRLMAAKGFGDSRQAEIRRSMQRAKGVSVFDDCDAPEYGSDIAEDDVASIATDFTVHTQLGRPRRRRHPNGPIPKVAGVVPGIACQTTEDDLPDPEDLEELEESKSRMLAEAAESRRLLLAGNGGRSREQVLEDALKSAESAIHMLKPRPVGAAALSEPDSPTTTYADSAGGGSVFAAWRPFGGGPSETYSRQASFVPMRPPAGAPAADPFKRGGGGGNAGAGAKQNGGGGGGGEYGKGPEPFSLEKITAETSFFSDHEAVTSEIPKATTSAFGGASVAIGGLVDYETAMARRRAIAGAEIALGRSDFIPKSEVLTLFVTYCNLGGHPELIEMLQKAVEAPFSAVTVSAVAKAVRATSRNATSSRVDMDSEAVRQRIRSTAWLLGVTWRRITNETYTSFLSRVLGWPADATSSMHRTRATQIIARALVRGHDLHTIPKAPRQH